MRERAGFFAPVAALAAMLGLCCGLPLLLSLGVLGAAAGVSVQSWALLAAGLVVAVVGWATRSRRRAGSKVGATGVTDHGEAARDAYQEARR